MGFYAGMGYFYLIAGNLNLLRKFGNYLQEVVESCPRRIICKCKVHSYELVDAKLEVIFLEYLLHSSRDFYFYSPLTFQV
jgi:hypothetical protein